MSMTGKKQLDRLSNCLSEKLGVNRPFGGIGLLIAGDFFQLPPVKDEVLYTQPKPTAKGFRQKTSAYNLYRTITSTNVVMLDTIMRTDNAEYIGLQENVRLGLWSDAIREQINARYNAPLTNNIPSDVLRQPNNTSTPDNYAPIMVVRNDTRQRLYESRMRTLTTMFNLQGTPLPIILTASFTNIRKRPSRADATRQANSGNSSSSSSSSSKNKKQKTQPRTNNTAPITSDELKYLQSLPDNNFDRIMSVFYLYIGAYVLFSQNLGLPYGLANGTSARIVGWQFPPNTTFKEIVYKGARVMQPFDATTNTVAKVDFILVELTSSTPFPSPPFQPPNLPKNVVAVPIIKHTVKNNITIPTTVSTRSTLSIHIEQVPLRQADILTTYSIQGSQFNYYVIAETIPSQFYIVFSRGKLGLRSITLQILLTTAFSRKAVPTKALWEEIARLRTLHDITALRFNTLP
jgi:hypothetical protein